MQSVRTLLGREKWLFVGNLKNIMQLFILIWLGACERPTSVHAQLARMWVLGASDAKMGKKYYSTK